MKTIAIILPKANDCHITQILETQLRLVFNDSVHITAHYLDSLLPDEKLTEDLFLIPLESGIFDLIKHVVNINSIIVITRVPSKQGMRSLFELPEYSDVLVVNYTDEATLHFANSLYELDVTNVNLIQFSQSAEIWKEYRHIQFAITPGEAACVPPFIKNIIDVGHRMIDSYTMLRIINKLGVRKGQIRFNLLKYIELLAEPETSLKDHYVASFLQIEMLKSYIHDIDEAMLLCDTSYRIVYTNNSFKRIFAYNSKESLAHCVGAERFSLISSTTFVSGLTSINKINYQLSKNPICVAEQLLGYCIMFRDEKMIRAMEGTLSNELMKTGFYAKYHFQDILHISASMSHCIDFAKKAAKSEHSIIISGESGTGKELFAQSIHNDSSRSTKPFVAINCAAMPENLLESELFGYEGGAFTGARKDGKLGLFEHAGGGSLFLDEVSEIPLSLQAKLLRVLQEKQIMRIGSDKVINVNVRIIAATNKNLSDEVSKGTFREDLYYRLNTLPIFLPPLRERAEDCLLLLKHFLGHEYAHIDAKDLQKVLQYQWPGNVRELQNAAYYYQTMHAFHFATTPLKQSPLTLHSTTKPYEEILLRIIAEHTSESHGIGRIALARILKAEGIQISDKKLRRLIKRLEENGSINIGNGRIGNRITEHGLLAL